MITILIPTTPDRKERLKLTLDSLHNQTVPCLVMVYVNQDGGVVKALHNMLEGIKNNTLVTIVNDDMVCEPDYVEKLQTAYIKAFGTGEGLAQGHDSFHHGRMYGDPLMPAWYYKRYWHKGYVHNFSDTEFTMVANILRLRAIYVPEAVKHHNHFLKDASLMDKTYESTQKFYEQDRELFENRIKEGFKTFNY